MPKKGTKIYYPRPEAEIVGYYNNAVTQLAGLVAKYGIAPATMTLLQTHNTNVQATYDQAIADASVAHNSNQTKYDEFAQAKIDLLNVFIQIQKAPNFVEGDAELLGFRVITEPIDLRTVKPVISGLTAFPENIIVDWVKGGLDGVKVYGSYDALNFTVIGQDSRSPFEDIRKNQTNQPEVRYYKLRYMKDDKLVGVESTIYQILAEIY